MLIMIAKIILNCKKNKLKYKLRFCYVKSIIIKNVLFKL